MRRSELVALDVADLKFNERSVRVTIRRSKTDQQGAGATIAVPAGRRLMPVDALRTWLDRAGITEGAVFRQVSNNGRRLLAGRLSDRGVARVVKARVSKTKYDSSCIPSFRFSYIEGKGSRGRLGVDAKAQANLPDV